MSTNTKRQGGRGAGRQRSPLLLAALVGGVVVAAVAGLALAGSGGSGGSGAEQAAVDEPARLDEQPPETGGEPLPDATVPMLDDDETRSLQAMAARSDGLVINFFASWCRPCLEELPQFQAVYEANKDDVAFLGVNLQDDPEAARGLVDRFGLAYPVGVDQQGELFRALGGFGMPTTVFVRPDGTIAETYSGELNAERLRARMRDHGLI